MGLRIDVALRRELGYKPASARVPLDTLQCPYRDAYKQTLHTHPFQKSRARTALN